MGSLTGHIAVVTGATGGIGRAITLALAAQGAELCLIGRNLEALKAIAARVQKTTKRALGYQVDLTVDQDIVNFAKHLRRDFGSIDIVVHCAGVISLGTMEIAPVEDLDWQYRTNVRAPYCLTQSLLPMIRLSRGQIVFVNSSIALNARATVSQYAATKHALKALADSLRQEVNPHGLRVLSVFLGRTATSMQAAVHEMECKEYHPERLLRPEDVASVVVHALSLPRSAEVTDIHIRPLMKA